MKKMMKMMMGSVVFCSMLTSCALTSTTIIQPKDAFVLGNNEHGKFSVRLKNVSENNLEIWETPITGGKHSKVVVKPRQTVRVKVDKNTALKIENNAAVTATVQLKVKGDLGLSMGYQK